MSRSVRGQASESRSGHWIVALADPATEWITGQVITVDGGLDLVA